MFHVSTVANGKPHIPLSGLHPSGAWYTKIAEPYPFKLRKKLAFGFHKPNWLLSQKFFSAPAMTQAVNQKAPTLLRRASLRPFGETGWLKALPSLGLMVNI